MPFPAAAVRLISTCVVHPRHTLAQTPPRRCDLTPWDVAVISLGYNQRGLLFHKPTVSKKQEAQPITIIIQRLKHSLSHALAHFSPLAGRLVFEKESSSSSHLFIDCNDAGAEFIHAVADISISHLLAPIDIHPMIESFFPLNRAVNFDGISLPLLAVQLTELTDGFFLGCAMNHVVGDGSSFWHFLHSWSEICRLNISGEDEPDVISISRPPILKRWFPPERPSPVSLPFSHPDEFIQRISPRPLRQRLFHFSPQSIAWLKSKANKECKTDTDKISISSFQAFSALVWRCITRARNLPADQLTSFGFPVDNRTRLKPSLPREYFGNCVQGVRATTKAGELLSKGLGWAAQQVHQIVADHSSVVARSAYDAWAKTPFFVHLSKFGNCDVMNGSSPRFDVYGVDFGWGKAVAVRCGRENKIDGKVAAFPGKEGGGSVDLEVCLSREVMCSLEADEEFMSVVASSSHTTCLTKCI